MFKQVTAFKNQQYAELRKQAINSGSPFRDPQFPPNARSLFYTPGKADGITWKRPKEICENPRFIVNGAKTADLIQGDLGNCWLVAACCCLTVNKSLWLQVVVDPEEQQRYALDTGICLFRFWRFGVRTDVVVDDYLPTRDNELVYCHSSSRDEFWSALLEKAYAKLCGSYEAMDTAELSEALEDFTGGVAENLDLSAGDYAIDDERRNDLFDWLVTLIASESLACAAIPAKSTAEFEQTNSVGLTKGHAYAITALRNVAFSGTGFFGLVSQGKLQMVKLRNPWGSGSEWRGPFSDGSPEWNSISSSEKRKIGLTFEDDGDFWMTFQDFCRYFPSVAICHRLNTSMVSLSRRWKEVSFNGEWVLPHRVGGCINNRSTFLSNPQYMIEVTEQDELLIELTQKMLRQSGRSRETIGFTVMRVEENRIHRVHVIMPIVVSSAFRNGRSVLVRRTFTRGIYVLVACTFEPGVLGSFRLRIFSGTSTSIRELMFDKPRDDGCFCFPSRRAVCVTQIKVIGVVGLEGSDEKYCVISCEGETVKSPYSTNVTNPEWNTYALFYRKYPLKKPITVEVYSHNIFGPDVFLGRQVFVAASDVKEQLIELPLVGRDDVMKAGRLGVVITTSNSLQAV